jgi:ubiquinone/menaquinone biosynthesis C-methylase UbiE
MAPSASRFDRWAGSYEDNTLQRFLFVPVHQTALELGLQLLADPRRILDVGCGTGRLLRQARRCFPTAELVGVDRARQMVATASAITPTGPAIRYVRGRAERLPFPDKVFDLVFSTLSLRHWTDLPAGVAESGRVLTPGGVLVLADVFPHTPRSGPALPMRRRRPPALPAQLGPVLAAHRLAVVDHTQTPWFGLPDVQVIAARRQARPGDRGPRRPRASPPAARPLVY